MEGKWGVVVWSVYFISCFGMLELFKGCLVCVYALLGLELKRGSWGKVGRGGAHGGVNVGVVGVWVLFRATCWKCLGDPCVLEMVCGW